VREALLGIEGVERVDRTTGEQDIIVLVEGEDYPGLLDETLAKVRSVPGVEKTVTNLVLE